MITKNKNSQIKSIHHRSINARLGALLLALTTAFNVGGFAKNSQGVVKADQVKLAFADVTAAENEIVRMPVRFDDGLRVQSTSSE